MALIILSGISGCIGQSPTSKGQYKDLEIVMELEKATFKKEEKIYITITTTNKGNDVISLNVKGYDIEIYSPDGEPIGRIKQRRGDKDVSLGPGASLFEYFYWYQTYKDSNSINTGLDFGKYYIVGYLQVGTYKDSEGDNSVEEDDIKTEYLDLTIDRS